MNADNVFTQHDARSHHHENGCTAYPHGNRRHYTVNVLKLKIPSGCSREAYLLGVWLYVRYAYGNVDNCPNFSSSR